MSLDAVLDRRLLIISGKGGVGKTTVAAALAIVAARRGKKVLLAEVEGKSALAELFDCDPLTPKPINISPGLDGMNISPEEALEEYFDVQLHMKRIAKPLIASNLVDYVTHAAPGLKDILILGKVWYTAVRRKTYDLIVFDSPAAGHAVSMLRSPEGFLHAVPVGPLANHARQVLDWLQDPDEVSIHLTSMAEEMPVNETLETTMLLESKLGMDVTCVFLNMLYPPLSDDADVQSQIDGLGSAGDLVERAAAAGAKLTTKQAQALYAAGDFYRHRRTLQAEHRLNLEKGVRDTATMVDLPYIFTDRFGTPELEQLADAIEKGLS